MAERIYDFHSHILPGMDDGCRSAAEAVQALEMSWQQGVAGVCLTPHFYADESIEEFLQRRSEAMERLRSQMDAHGGPFPELCLGSEVAWYPDISRTEGLSKLCLGNSRYLLLELPFCKWGSQVLQDLQTLCAAGFVPILAHIDRYWSMQSRDTLKKVLSLDLYAQVNGAALLDWKRRSRAKNWLTGDLAQFLGSDCHNTVSRVPNLGLAMQRLPEEVSAELSRFAAQIWEKIAG